MSGLRPLHWSKRQQGRPISPAGLTHIEVSQEQVEALESVALDVFTDMTNSGATLQASLAAVYMTGIQHALTMRKEPTL